MGSGLHATVMNGKIQVAWLLLFLASDLELPHFPADMLLAAERLRSNMVFREDQNVEIAIRSLKDTSERVIASQRALMLENK